MIYLACSAVVVSMSVLMSVYCHYTELRISMFTTTCLTAKDYHTHLMSFNPRDWFQENKHVLNRVFFRHCLFRVTMIFGFILIYCFISTIYMRIPIQHGRFKLEPEANLVKWTWFRDIFSGTDFPNFPVPTYVPITETLNYVDCVKKQRYIMIQSSRTTFGSN